MSDLEGRAAKRQEFLNATEWAEARLEAFPGDASTRQYFRLHRADKTAILMDAPSASETPVAPADANPQARSELGYNALARLAGNNVIAFTGLAEALTMRGFSAPRILDADLDQGFVILEDLDDALLARLLPDQASEIELYKAAVDCLAAIYRSTFGTEVSFRNRSWEIHHYDETALMEEARLFVHWYEPHRGEGELGDEALEEYEQLFLKLFAKLDVHAPGLVLRDFHAENLIWLPDREDEARVGLLDFQDALIGHPAYDLVSLLEDARRDVDPAIVEDLKTRFFERALLRDREAFDAAYAILAAQRNAKILGIFVRLAIRDGKPKYLDLLPRVARHFCSDLDHPALKDLRHWVHQNTPEVFREAGR